MIYCLPAMYRPVVRLAAATGYRINDICNARMCDYDEDAQTLTLRESKTGKVRTVAIKPDSDAYNAIRYQNKIRPCERTWLMEPTYGKPANRKTVWYWMRKAAEYSGISDDLTLTPHSLRKFYAVRQRMRGKSLQDVQADFGHDRPETTMVYYYADVLSGYSERSNDVFQSD